MKTKIEKEYVAIGDNNYWYAFGDLKYCKSQARKALKNPDTSNFDDKDLPIAEVITIYEVKEVDEIYND